MEEIKKKRYRRVRVKNTQIEPIKPTIDDEELEKFINSLREPKETLSKQLWDGFINVISYILSGIGIIFASIIGLGGCLLNFIWMGIAFYLGWWFISAIYNWIF